MADMTLPEVIARFRGNEARITGFTNGNADGSYTTTDGKKVETLPSLVTRLAAAIATASSTRNDLAATTGSTLVGHGSVTLKAYLDAQATAQSNIKATADAALPKTGGTMTGALLLKGAPTQDLEPATKAYADLLAMQNGFQEFTSSGTFSKPDKAKWIIVEGVGGGAGGQWASLNTNFSGQSLAAGGDGGSYNFKMFRASDVPSTVAVVVGTGGVGGNSSTNAGKAGGDTTFGSFLTAKGAAAYGGKFFYIYAPPPEHSWVGGLGGQPYINTQGNNGGVTNATASIKGGGGGAGATSINSTMSVSSPGASVDAGNGGTGNTNISQPGGDGIAPGGGGAGTSGGTAGGKGANGRLRVWWM